MGASKPSGPARRADTEVIALLVAPDGEPAGKMKVTFIWHVQDPFAVQMNFGVAPNVVPWQIDYETLKQTVMNEAGVVRGIGDIQMAKPVPDLIDIQLRSTDEDEDGSLITAIARMSAEVMSLFVIRVEALTALHAAEIAANIESEIDALLQGA